MKTHLLAASQLTCEEIRSYLDTAKKLKSKLGASQSLPLLQGKLVVNFFFENSTRTRASFEMAIRRLGGSAMNFAASTSSVQKGETLIDTAKNIEAMCPQAIVLRHSSAGSPLTLSQAVKVPVINAGDGFHEHPTQGLLDAFTMEEHFGSLQGKRVMIMGDIAHSRVARSNIHILKKLGASVVVCGPPTLIPPNPDVLGVEYVYLPEKALPQVDVVMTLRIQLERQNKMQLPTLREYQRFWGLNRERAKLLKSTALIMHPGPVNRGVELDHEVADSPRSVILDQVANGVVVRMAVLAVHCNPEGLKNWMEQNK